MNLPITSRLLRPLAGLIALCSVLPAAAALKVGDPAPKLQPASWVQGDPVKEFEGDKVYIVEFWATWCGPCIAAIPHLNEFHKKFEDKGLVVIGQNVWERDVKAVPGFVKKMGAKMTYRVALDDTSAKEGVMATDWLTAAGQNGIPCGFVVDKKGKIAYIGHPMGLKESLLEELLAVPSTKPAAPAAGATDTASTPSPKTMALARRAATEIAEGKLDQAEATIAEVHASLSEKFGYVGGLLDIELMLARKQSDNALELAKVIAEDFSKSPMVLAMVAERLIGRPDATTALRTAAGKYAKLAGTPPGDARGRALATLARIEMMEGDKAKAVTLQTKAVALATDSAAAKAVLASYQQGKLPDQP